MKGMAGMERLLHFGALHHACGFAKANLLLIEHEGVGENIGDAFELMMGGDDEVSTIRELDEIGCEMASTFDIETIERFVKEKDVSFLGESTGDVSSLLLAAGELVDLAIGNVLQLQRGERGLALLGICFWREGLEAALGPELRGEKGGWPTGPPGDSGAEKQIPRNFPEIGLNSQWNYRLSFSFFQK